jgi:hypothetical protein
MRIHFGWLNFAWIKRGLLLFWALWYSVVVTTNVLNALQALGILPAGFKFVSGNWEWINRTMNPLGVPIMLQAFLFAGVIVWQILCAILFFVACARFRDRRFVEEKESLWACAVALALWGAFQVLDEVFLAYDPESVHRVIFIETILTMMFLQLMPRDNIA